MYTIYIIRHGETDNNKKRVLQGRSNLPLNEEGVRQAEKARDSGREAGLLTRSSFCALPGMVRR